MEPVVGLRMDWKYLMQTMDTCSQALHSQEKISYFKYRNNHYKSLSNLETENKLAHFSDLTIPQGNKKNNVQNQWMILWHEQLAATSIRKKKPQTKMNLHRLLIELQEHERIPNTIRLW